MLLARSSVPVLIACLALTSCAGDPDSSSPSPSPSPSSPPSSSPSVVASSTPADPGYVVRRVSAGNAPCGILGARGRIWVSNYSDDSLVSIDPATGVVSTPIPTGDSPCGLASGAGSIWVENYGSDDVTRVDARTGEVQGTFPVGSQPYDVTFADGAAWTSDFSGGTVSRIDAATGKVSRVKTGGQPIGVAAVAGQVWVGLNYGGVAAVDTATGKVGRRRATEEPATWTAYDGDRLWMDVGDTVERIDGRSGEVTGTVTVGSTPNDGTIVGDEVWVGDKDGKVYRFSTQAADGAATAVASGVGNPFVVAAWDGLLWVADFAGTDVVAIDPTLVP